MEFMDLYQCFLAVGLAYAACMLLSTIFSIIREFPADDAPPRPVPGRLRRSVVLGGTPLNVYEKGAAAPAAGAGVGGPELV